MVTYYLKYAFPSSVYKLIHPIFTHTKYAVFSVLSPVTWSLPVLRWRPVTRILLARLVREVHAFRVSMYSLLILGKPKGYVSGDSYPFVPQWAGQDADAALQPHFLQIHTMELRSSFLPRWMCVFETESHVAQAGLKPDILPKMTSPDFPASNSRVLGYSHIQICSVGSTRQVLYQLSYVPRSYMDFWTEFL